MAISVSCCCFWYFFADVRFSEVSEVAGNVASGWGTPRCRLAGTGIPPNPHLWYLLRAGKQMDSFDSNTSGHSRDALRETRGTPLEDTGPCLGVPGLPESWPPLKAVGIWWAPVLSFSSPFPGVYSSPQWQALLLSQRRVNIFRQLADHYSCNMKWNKRMVFLPTLHSASCGDYLFPTQGAQGPT